MKKSKLAVIITVTVVLIAAVILGSSCFFVTYQNEYGIVRRFDKIVDVTDTAGIHIKLPFVDTVTTAPKEIMLYDLSASDVITSDKKTMLVDSYVLWHIIDVQKFAQSLNSSISNAEYRIDAIVYNATKNVISATKQDDVISGRDGQLSQMVRDAIGDSTDQYGIELVAVEIKRLDLPSDNKDAVYTRMISERNQIQAQYEAEGEAEAQKIKNETDKTVGISISDAEAQAAQIEAEGEAEYMRILAEAYDTEDKREFYEFTRALDAAKTALTGSGDKTLILTEDSPLAQLFITQ